MSHLDESLRPPGNSIPMSPFQSCSLPGTGSTLSLSLFTTLLLAGMAKGIEFSPIFNVPRKSLPVRLLVMASILPFVSGCMTTINELAAPETSALFKAPASLSAPPLLLLMKSGAELSGMEAMPFSTAGVLLLPMRSMNSGISSSNLTNSSGPRSIPSSTLLIEHHTAATPRPCSSSKT